MNKKMREIKAQIEVLNDEAVKMFEAKNLEGAESKLVEIENLEREYKLAEKLFKEEKETVAAIDNFGKRASSIAMKTAKDILAERTGLM